MKIKVCGMRNPQNIAELACLPVDIMGFIFYEKSQRFVGQDFPVNVVQSIPANIAKAAVFVNSSKTFILEIQNKYSFDYIQLHGNEDVQFCEELKKQTDAKIIKAFQIDSKFDFSQLHAFIDVVDYFLFDTKTELYGGSGNKFDWKLLEKYDCNKPFFLSGGISIVDIEQLTGNENPLLFAIDINSKFEIAPAIKDIQLIKEFISKVKEKNC